MKITKRIYIKNVLQLHKTITNIKRKKTLKMNI